MSVENKYPSKIVRISSHERNLNLSSQTSSDFKVDVPSYSNQFNQVIAVQVLSAEIPHLFYNIDEYNNTFVFTTTGDAKEHTITMTQGQYVLTKFLDDLMTALDTELVGVNTYSFDDDVTQKVTLNFSEDVSFTPNADTNPIPVRLGFGVVPTLYTTTASSITAPNVVNLMAPASVYVHCKELAQQMSDLDNDADTYVLFRMKLDKDFGQSCYYDSNDSVGEMIRYRNPRSFHEFTFSIRDHRGRILNSHDTEWHFQFRYWHLV